MKKYIRAVILISMIAFSLCFASIVKADPYTELMQIQMEIEELEARQQEIVQEIKGYSSNIVDLEIRIEQSKKAIEDKESRIQKKEQKLKVKEEEKQQQYEAMKTRIQYLYQNGQDTGLLVFLFNDENVSSFLDKVELANELYTSDRLMLNQFILKIEEINLQKSQILQEKEKLELQKIGLEQNVNELEQVILELKKEENLNDFDIQQATRDAAALANEIAEIEREIAAKEAEKYILYYNQPTLAVVDDMQLIAAPAASQVTSEEVTTPQTQIYSSNSDIVSYANQFVGNPYSWGGNSLTNGVDCSHFVWNVLKDTGHYSGGYAVADDWSYLGQSVSSLDQAQAGDVVVYSGHVAIYDGQGGIIQAQSSQAGITNDRAADSGTIVSIRHFE